MINIYAIYKKVIDEAGNENWVFINEVDTFQELENDLEYLRTDGFEYRAELKTDSTSSILGV
jgi:hypothetical protein